jgi:hypothetical protein
MALAPVAILAGVLLVVVLAAVAYYVVVRECVRALWRLVRGRP